MLTGSVLGLPGLTLGQLKAKCDWMANYSMYGLEIYAHHAELNGFIRSEGNKHGDLVYFATRKGKKEHNAYHDG